MNILKDHLPILFLMTALTFVAFGTFLSTPIWNDIDASILCEANQLSQDVGAVFRHLGFYFSQPLLQMAFLAEFKLFGLNPTGYIVVNLLVHAFNSFLVYMLVHMLFPRKGMAVLAATLFALGVGSYGKILMSVHNLEALVLAGLHLMVLYVFIRNDFRSEGKLRSPLFFLGLILFLLTGLTKSASFSLLGTLIAYKAFFYKGRGRRAILSADLVVFAVICILFYWAQYQWGYRDPLVFDHDTTGLRFSLISIKNLFRYLTLMFFPLQYSPLLQTASPAIVWLYEAKVVIRFALTLAIISYSFFGFVFGSRAVRFFIAWTYITLIPFTGIKESGQWLNLSHLYLTSLGFCVILAAGTVGTSALLIKAGWRRYLPFLIPLIFAGASIGLAHKLDHRNKFNAEQPRAEALRAKMQETCRLQTAD